MEKFLIGIGIISICVIALSVFSLCKASSRADKMSDEFGQYFE